MVRAKFKVSSISRSMGQSYVDGKYVPREQWTIHMSPVMGRSDESDENKKFWAATPGGEIKLICVNKSAVESFDLEKEYYVDFTES